MANTDISSAGAGSSSGGSADHDEVARAEAKQAQILAESKAAVDAIWDKKGFEVAMLQVGAIVQYTDYMIIASATSDRHAMAIADNVEAHLLATHRSKPIGTEGRQSGRWIIIDYSDFVVHIFHRPVREYYQLDRLYGDAPRVPLEEPAWVRETTPDTILEQAQDYGDLLWEEAAVDPSRDEEADDDLAAFDDDEVDGADPDADDEAGDDEVDADEADDEEADDAAGGRPTRRPS